MDFEEKIGDRAEPRDRASCRERREDASDLSRRPFAIAARRRNAAFVQRRCDGSPRRCAARLYLFDHRLEGESDLDVAFAALAPSRIASVIAAKTSTSSSIS